MLIFGQDGAAAVVERDTREDGRDLPRGGRDQRAGGGRRGCGRQAAGRPARCDPRARRLAPTLILEDATVPRSELAAMVRDVQRIAEEEGLLIAVFGHAGDGNLHPTMLHRRARPRPGGARAPGVRRASSRRRSRAAGTITGEHGIGVTKLQYLSSALGPVGIDLLRGIKRAFDPLGLLNPGKAVP